MGSTQVKTSTEQKVTPTEEEKRLEQLQLGQAEAFDPYARKLQAAGGELGYNLLTGNEAGLPSFYQGMTGIDPYAIGQQATELYRQNVPGFQSSGLVDSGVKDREISRMIANQLLYPAAQYNIGAKQNLLNLALSGQAQVQAPSQANYNQLGQQLAGLRTVTGQNTQTTTPSTLSMIMSGMQGIGSLASGAGGFMTGLWGNR